MKKVVCPKLSFRQCPKSSSISRVETAKKLRIGSRFDAFADTRVQRRSVGYCDISSGRTHCNFMIDTMYVVLQLSQFPERIAEMVTQRERERSDDMFEMHDIFAEVAKFPYKTQLTTSSSNIIGAV